MRYYDFAVAGDKVGLLEIIMKLICPSPFASFTALSAISQVCLKKRQQQHLKT